MKEKPTPVQTYGSYYRSGFPAYGRGFLLAALLTVAPVLNVDPGTGFEETDSAVPAGRHSAFTIRRCD